MVITECNAFRDDLQIPSSPFFPAYAQSGQGPPPVVQERFMSVVSQLFQHVRSLFIELNIFSVIDIVKFDI